MELGTIHSTYGQVKKHWCKRNNPEKVKMDLMVDYLRMLAVSVPHKKN